MRVRFWGTRGSIAKAGPSTVRYGGNTSCVEVRTTSGTVLILDCGTGAHGLGQALLEEVDRPTGGHILISHTHWDHIQGFPFFYPLRKEGEEWHVYGPRGMSESLRETLSGQMQYAYFPLELKDLGADVHYHDLVEGSFEAGDVRVTTHYLHHTALTLGYRLESEGVAIVYATDHEPHSRKLAAGGLASFYGEDARHTQFLSGADLVIHDAQYTAEEYPSKIGWGHSTVEYVVDAAMEAGARRLALFHHDPSRDDDAVTRLVEDTRARVAASSGSLEVFAAAEGAELKLDPVTSVHPSRTASEQAATMHPTRAPQNESVLVAVRNPVSVELGRAIRSDNLPLLEAADADEVLALVERERPAVVILDRGLPGGDVLNTCRRIRATPGEYGKNVTLVLVKEREGAEAEREMEGEAGINDLLVKPFSEVYARTRVRAWVLRTACRWIRAPLPENEAQRIESLHHCAILDTAPEERFDRITRIAAALFQVPMVLVSLVDSDRQWFKSHYGLEATETDRDRSFCAHAILGDDMLHVTDAFQDDRFADNPLVTGDPHIRFYAGVPLALGDGARVGTLCLLDRRPRCLDEAGRQMLIDLAKLVEHELSGSSVTAQMRKNES